MIYTQTPGVLSDFYLCDLGEVIYLSGSLVFSSIKC